MLQQPFVPINQGDGFQQPMQPLVGRRPNFALLTAPLEPTSVNLLPGETERGHVHGNNGCSCCGFFFPCCCTACGAVAMSVTNERVMIKRDDCVCASSQLSTTLPVRQVGRSCIKRHRDRWPYILLAVAWVVTGFTIAGMALGSSGSFYCNNGVLQARGESDIKYPIIFAVVMTVYCVLVILNQIFCATAFQLSVWSRLDKKESHFSCSYRTASQELGEMFRIEQSIRAAQNEVPPPLHQGEATCDPEQAYYFEEKLYEYKSQYFSIVVTTTRVLVINTWLSGPECLRRFFDTIYFTEPIEDVTSIEYARVPRFGKHYIFLGLFFLMEAVCCGISATVVKQTFHGSYYGGCSGQTVSIGSGAAAFCWIMAVAWFVLSMCSFFLRSTGIMVRSRSSDDPLLMLERNCCGAMDFTCQVEAAVRYAQMDRRMSGANAALKDTQGPQGVVLANGGVVQQQPFATQPPAAAATATYYMPPAKTVMS